MIKSALKLIIILLKLCNKVCSRFYIHLFVSLRTKQIERDSEEQNVIKMNKLQIAGIRYYLSGVRRKRHFYA